MQWLAHVIMMVADVLAPNSRQYISNHYDDYGVMLIVFGNILFQYRR